jgi:hypothetical protein
MTQSDPLFGRFSDLFLELDGGPRVQRREVTRACVAALFDRMISPPETNEDVPTESDVDRTVQALTAIIEAEADRVRRQIASSPFKGGS